VDIIFSNTLVNIEERESAKTFLTPGRYLALRLMFLD